MAKNPTQFFIYRTKDREGPFSESKIAQMLRDQKLKPNHFVWWEGQKDWVKCENAIWPFSIEALPPAPPNTFSAPQFVPIKDAIPALKEEFSALLELSLPETQESTAIIDRSSLRVASAEARRAERIDKKNREKIYPEKQGDPIIQFIRFSVGISVLAVCAVIGAAAVGYPPARGIASQVGKISYILVNWFSPIPILNDITPVEYQALKKIASDEEKKVPRFELVQSRSTIDQPTLYFTTNLPDGITYQLEIKSVTGRILGKYRFETTLDFFPLKNFARLPLKDLTSKEIPPGEYFLTVREALNQSDLGKRILEEFIESRKIANAASNGPKIVFRKVLFLGGKPDQAFLENLSQFQTTLKLRATEEINQLSEMLTLLKQTESRAIANASTSVLSKTSRAPAGAKSEGANTQWLNEFREKVLGRLQGKSADYYREQFLLGDVFVSILSATVRVREEVTRGNGLPAPEVFDGEWKDRLALIEGLIQERKQKIETGEFFSYSAQKEEGASQ